MPTSSTGRAGLTLVELTVVILLVAVLSAMIVPTMAGRAGRQGLAASARQLLTTARYARDCAVTRQCTCRLVVDEAARRYVMAFGEEGAAAPAELPPGAAFALRPAALPEGVRFGRLRIDSAAHGQGQGVEAAAQPAPNQVLFRPEGRADAAIIELTDGRWTLSLVILPETGRAELVEGTVAELPNERIDLDM